MNNASISTVPSPFFSKTITLASHEPDSAVALAITAHVASLKLPPFPKKVVGAARMSPTDLRCKAALAVYAALPDLDLAILPNVANAAKLSVKEALIASKDLIACGLVACRLDGYARNVYELASAS